MAISIKIYDYIQTKRHDTINQNLFYRYSSYEEKEKLNLIKEKIEQNGQMKLGHLYESISNDINIDSIEELYVLLEKYEKNNYIKREVKNENNLPYQVWKVK